VEVCLSDFDVIAEDLVEPDLEGRNPGLLPFISLQTRYIILTRG